MDFHSLLAGREGDDSGADARKHREPDASGSGSGQLPGLAGAASVAALQASSGRVGTMGSGSAKSSAGSALSERGSSAGARGANGALSGAASMGDTSTAGGARGISAAPGGIAGTAASPLDASSDATGSIASGASGRTGAQTAGASPAASTDDAAHTLQTLLGSGTGSEPPGFAPAAVAAPAGPAAQRSGTASSPGTTLVASPSADASGSSTGQSGTADAGPALDPEQQLLAWLSQTAAVQAGTGRAGLGASTADNADGATSQGADPSGSASSSQGGAIPDASQGAGALLSSLAAPTHAALAAHSATATLQSPLGSNAWTEELGAQLTWMAGHGIDSASLHVSPAELGPIEVRIAVHGTDASVWFGAQQPATRTALEHALPQLRQLFAAQGLALGDTGVFREPPRESPRQSPAQPLAMGPSAPDATARVVEARTTGRAGLLDLYA